jgi:hypothetical protein
LLCGPKRTVNICDHCVGRAVRAHSLCNKARLYSGVAETIVDGCLGSCGIRRYESRILVLCVYVEVHLFHCLHVLYEPLVSAQVQIHSGQTFAEILGDVLDFSQ